MILLNEVSQQSHKNGAKHLKAVLEDSSTVVNEGLSDREIIYRILVDKKVANQANNKETKTGDYETNHQWPG